MKADIYEKTFLIYPSFDHLITPWDCQWQTLKVILTMGWPGYFFKLFLNFEFYFLLKKILEKSGEKNCKTFSVKPGHPMLRVKYHPTLHHM